MCIRKGLVPRFVGGICEPFLKRGCGKEESQHSHVWAELLKGKKYMIVVVIEWLHV
jgi:hypothetical protein